LVQEARTFAQICKLTDGPLGGQRNVKHILIRKGQGPVPIHKFTGENVYLSVYNVVTGLTSFLRQDPYKLMVQLNRFCHFPEIPNKFLNYCCGRAAFSTVCRQISNSSFLSLKTRSCFRALNQFYVLHRGDNKIKRQTGFDFFKTISLIFSCSASKILIISRATFSVILKGKNSNNSNQN
jgi:hypothetical protein